MPLADPTRPSGLAARLPFYYGWVDVAIAAVAMSATLPGRTYGLGIIKENLCAGLLIDDLRFNWLNFWAVVIGAAVVMPVGWLIDRLGTRLTLALVASALGGSVLLMARAGDERELAVTLTLVRGFGQGALSVVAIALVGKWFRRRVGVAMGAFTVLLSVGFVVPIGIVEGANAAHGWRYAWDGVGLALLVGLVPLGLLFARSSPEACGVPPDDPAPEENLPAPMTIRQALATPAFWVFTLAAALFNLTFSALTLVNTLLLKEHGMEGKETTTLVLAVLMVSGLPANLVAGYLARKLALGKMLAVGLVVLGASLTVFPFVGSVGGAAVYAVLLGVSGGVITVVYFSVYGHTYGRTNLGGIQAVVQVLSVFASAIGPVILATVRDGADGVTAPFFFAFAAGCVPLAVLAWVVRPPKSEPAA